MPTKSRNESTQKVKVTAPKSGIIMVRASDITPQKIDWLRDKVILNGRVTGIVGSPDQGKSLLTADLAAAVSTGAPWPTGSSAGKRGQVIILSDEDHPDDTIVPRLKAAGADLKRVRIIMAVTDGNGAKRIFNLATDLAQVGKKILKMEQDGRPVRLLILDPISAYLGFGDHGLDRNNARHIRGLFNELGAFAAKHQLAIVFVLHRPKGRKGSALMQMAGSYEFAAGPRMSLLVVGEKGTNAHLLVPCKQNLGPSGVGYRYRIKVKKIGNGIKAPYIEFEQASISISADEALAAESGKGASRPTKPDAQAWLLGVLAKGPMRRKSVIKLGARAGFSTRQLRTARESLGVTTTKRHVGSQTVWALPVSGKRKSSSS
jgi:putative DNA primase/helicase